MIVYFTTVIRSAPPAAGGELVRLNWQTKRVEGRVPIAATNPTLNDPNRRGNTRGGRGISLVGNDLVVCSYHTLRVFGRDLELKRDITHPLMVSLHETEPSGDGSVWTTPTAIDAAIEFDLASGQPRHAFWPRELPGFQRSLGLTPLSIDKLADNRARFLGAEHTRHPHHLHLNAVAVHGGEIFALFSKFGVIANLDRQELVVQDNALRGAHNLLIDGAGQATVSHTLGRGILMFDLASGQRNRRIGFGEHAGVRRLVRFHDVSYAVKRFLARHHLFPHTPPRPVFVRGLARSGGHLFAGISPATILQIDERSGAVLDMFTYRHDVAACIHGLEVDPAPPTG